MASKIKNKFTPSYLRLEPRKSDIGNEYIVNIQNLCVNFKVKSGVLHAVRDVSLKIKKGEILGIVGESGSGKSVTVKSLIGFNDNSTTTAQNLDFDKWNLLTADKSNWKYIRGSKIAYIPQDPLLSLNPTKRIGKQIIESILVTKKRKYQQRLYDLKKEFKENKNKEEYNKLKKEATKEYKESITKEAINKKVYEVLDFIGIKNIEQRIKDYPHEFSGGMRQRIVIAMAIVSEPDLIIADEPTTALDVTIQAKVLDIIKKLRDKYNIAIVLISHNIGLVANFCDFIYVMYAGKIVEQGLVKDIFTNPRHPYTWALISSIPDSSSDQELQSIPGTPPNLLIPPIGDAFAPRNKYAIKIDFEKQPPLFKVDNSETHKAATWLLHPDSPITGIPANVLEKIKVAKKSIEIKEKLETSKRIKKTKKVDDDLVDNNENIENKENDLKHEDNINEIVENNKINSTNDINSNNDLNSENKIEENNTNAE